MVKSANHLMRCPKCFADLPEGRPTRCSNENCDAGMIFYCQNEACGAPLLQKWRLSSGRCPACLKPLNFMSPFEWPMHGKSATADGYQKSVFNMELKSKFHSYSKMNCDFGAPVAAHGWVCCAGTLKERHAARQAPDKLIVMAISVDMKNFHTLEFEHDSVLGQYSTPTIWRSFLYVPTLRGNIRVFDLSDGLQTVGTMRATGSVYSGMVVHGNLGFLTTSNPGSLVCYELRLDRSQPLKKRWDVKLYADVHSYPCVDSENNRVIVFQSDGFGFAYDFSGNPNGYVKVDGVNQMRSSPIVSGGFLFVGCGGPGARRIVAYDRNTFEFAGSIETDVAIHASPVAHKNVIYYPLSQKTLLAINNDIYNSSINEIGRFTTRDQLQSTPAISKNAVIQGDMGGNLYFLEPGLGTELRPPVATVQGADLSNVIVYQDRIFVTMQPHANANGRLYCFYSE